MLKIIYVSIGPGSISDLMRSRWDLIFENAMQRQQLIIFNWQIKRLHPTTGGGCWLHAEHTIRLFKIVPQCRKGKQQRVREHEQLNILADVTTTLSVEERKHYLGNHQYKKVNPSIQEVYSAVKFGNDPHRPYRYGINFFMNR